ncbi:MAG: hypothetical protein FJ313_00895 [Gemmatimonadetes bacterium]|nr:hypothetical protein [Gemmatimonadota bacterium]
MVEPEQGPGGERRCARCGEAEGTGLACAACAKVRVARNAPPQDPVEAMIREGRRRAAGEPTARGAAREEEETMRPGLRRPGESLPPIRAERPRGVRFACADCGAPISGWGKRCRKCAGLARRGRRVRPAGQGTGQAAGGPAASAAGVGEAGTPGVPGAPAATGPARPAGALAVSAPRPPARAAPAADEGPGPLTLAVCNFFGEVARASDHIEARMTLDRRRLAITVELALPGAGAEERR